MPITAGIDVGTGAIKVALFNVEGATETCLVKRVERMRQRDPLKLAEQIYDDVLVEAGLKRGDVAYCATTGEGEALHFHTGHFYSMTTHARGAIYLRPDCRAALDIGALHGRAIRLDERGKVLNYKMTSQCASGSGQFLENIARYLGIAQDEIGIAVETGGQSGKGLRHLRGARRDRRHQHGVPRHHGIEYSQGNSRIDGGSSGQAPEDDRWD